MAAGSGGNEFNRHLLPVGTAEALFAATLKTHFGQKVFNVLGESYAPITESVLVLLVLWLICAWMYRQRIFVRI